jgi:hypothetical protein
LMGATRTNGASSGACERAIRSVANRLSHTER